MGWKGSTPDTDCHIPRNLGYLRRHITKPTLHKLACDAF